MWTPGSGRLAPSPRKKSRWRDHNTWPGEVTDGLASDWPVDGMSVRHGL